MKSVRFGLLIGLLSFATASFAQSTHDHPAAATTDKTPTEAQKAFAEMKSLAGEWEGKVKTDMPIAASMDAVPMHVTMRVTSRGNVLVHEFQEANTPLDPTKYDHPVTMVYLDSDQLNLVHYCDAGNRPHMTAKTSEDGKKIEFDFVDIGGKKEIGYMHNAGFTIVDENHHIENWRFFLPNGAIVNATFDLHRVK